MGACMAGGTWSTLTGFEGLQDPVHLLQALLKVREEHGSHAWDGCPVDSLHAAQHDAKGFLCNLLGLQGCPANKVVNRTAHLLKAS